MISKELETALNDQINYELTAAYAYMAMAAWFEDKSYPGCTQWMTMQANEERAHADKFGEHVFDRGGKVIYDAIGKPKGEFESIKQVFEYALELEQGNTTNINDLYTLALKQNDYAAQSMLQWFIDEQVEEEKSINDILALIEMTNAHPAGLLMLDQQLGARQPEAE